MLTRFEEWAFGEDFDSETTLENIPDIWNRRHGDILYISGNRSFRDSYIEMIRLWTENDKDDEFKGD